MVKPTSTRVSTDDLIRYLNINIALVNTRIQRLAQITASGGFLDADEIANLNECNDVSKASSDILDIFSRTNWIRPATREILAEKLDSILDNRITSTAAIKVYLGVMRGLDDK